MWRWLRTLTFRPSSGPPSLRAIALPAGEPYREDPAAPPRERTPDPCTLAQLLAGLAAAELAFRPHRRGFDVFGAVRTRMMPVRISDPARIVPERLTCGADAPELLLDLALALVPVFGPLLAEVRFAGTILVDGTRDRLALGEEAAQRIQRVGARVAARAPAAFPILHDLAMRMRQQR